MIIGLDMGGTHTDVVLLDQNGLVRQKKVLTDAKDLFATVLKGLDTIMDGLDADIISRAVLSTTLTTNAIVQNRIKPVGMIVTGGPGLDPELFRTNSYYHIVSGSIDHRGREIQSVNEDEIKQIADSLKREGISHVGIVGKFSTRNPSHELKIAGMLQGMFDKLFMGHHSSGNLNFPRRIATTYLNAAVYPIHKEFFNAVKKSLESKGLKIPIHILKADGGTMSFASSIDFPGQTILSGPAASVMGAALAAPEKGDVLVFDIGGTTTDIGVLIDGVPVLEPLGIEIGPYKTLIRSLKTYSIGVGGDSYVRFSNNVLTIGPERMGPALAYGGPEVTPTDALFVLEKIEGGDRDRAIQGIGAIAKERGVSVEDAAREIIEKTCDLILAEAGKMIVQINSKPVYTVYDVLEGYRLNPDRILVLGGPAAYFSKHLGLVSDFNVTAVPQWGVANAIGAAIARTTSEVTLFADTEQGVITSSEGNFSGTCNKSYSKENAISDACDLLKKKSILAGASADDFEMEVIEELEFNMVRGFYTSGKNIRVKVQVKPGIISGYEKIGKKISPDIQ
ncbi:MAG: hydantoinase/oxoprolinase family protein [Proteobacteria bacterium]|nr:hydantoinase/oxoprolinase family protein [Pseudomonadota bacterium]